MSEHQHNWGSTGNRLDPVITLDDWMGPVTGLVKCNSCESYGLFYLVAWEAPALKNRVFALRVVPGDVADTYIRNVSRDYCDLTRKQSETEALFAAAKPVSHLIDTSDATLLQQIRPCTRQPAQLHWRDIRPEDYGQWKKAFSN